MNVCRFDDDQIGIVEGDFVVDLTGLVPREAGHEAVWLATLPKVERATLLSDRRKKPLADVHLHSPIARPGKVIAAPVNYRAHVLEMQENGQAHGHLLTDIRQAGLFLKASSSVVGASHGIQQKFLDRRTDHEVELCVVIGQEAREVSAADALAHVAGYCIGIDITLRGPEDRSFRKSIDTYCVLGPWLTTTDAVPDAGNIELELSVNGEVRQKANTADMVLGVAELIEFASLYYSLLPGDVIMTGTPQGVGPIRPGDRLFAKATGLGGMVTRVSAAHQAQRSRE